MQRGILDPDLALLFKTPELAPLGPERRQGVFGLAPQLIDSELKVALAGPKFTPAIRDLFRATFYLWHDHLEAAHSIAQAIETSDGSLLHGIMHRREGDYGNAKYWFKRVGTHPSFLSLAVRASELLEKHDESDLHSRLVPNKTWDPFAFVDAVEDANEGQFKSKAPLLQQLQKMELECFLENLVNRV